jgi:hypothetical protein
MSDILQKIRPAELLIFKNGTSVEFKDLLKYTFLDLLLRQVLKTSNVQKQAHKRDRVRTYTYVQRGHNFNSYEAKGFELVFLSAFEKSPQIKILFKHLVAMSFENTEGKKKYLRSILGNGDVVKGAFKDNILFAIFSTLSLTPQGVEKKDELDASIKDYTTRFNAIDRSDKEKGIELFAELHGNIFLLDDVDQSILKAYDKEFVLEFQKRSNSASGAYGCDGYWMLFDDYSSSFDGASSVFGDSGCGGDSGCSGGGCSGCGGCGGCGG